MAGMFEVFLDADSHFRFRLRAPDGTVMAVSEAFRDKAAVAAGIAAVRECAGMGLVTDLSVAPREQHAPVHAPVPAPVLARSAAMPAASVPVRPVPGDSVPAATGPAAARTPGTAEPACDEQLVPVSRVRAFAHFNAVRGRVSGARWSSAV